MAVWLENESLLQRHSFSKIPTIVEYPDLLDVQRRSFIEFLQEYNGLAYFDKESKPVEHEVFIDACLEGMGAIWGDHVYATPIPVTSGAKFDIVHLEMVNIVVCL